MKKRKSISLIDKLKAVKKDIKIAFFISFLSVIFIELILKNYDSPSVEFYKIGEIYLRVCYSVIATIIFFVINQHLPKENRNANTHRYISNKFGNISSEISWLLETIGLEKNLDISKEELTKALAGRNENLPVEEFGMLFPNYISYLRYKIERIKSLLNEILILNSSIESDLLERLTYMHDALDRFHIFNEKSTIKYGPDLSFFSHPLNYLMTEINQASKIMYSERYNKYRDTTMNRYRNNSNQ